MTAPYPATPRQMDLLRFIAGYNLVHCGASPSYSEMMAGIKAPSKSNVAWLLDQLEQRGHIIRSPYNPRGIRVTSQPTIPLAPDGDPLFAVPGPWSATQSDTEFTK